MSRRDKHYGSYNCHSFASKKTEKWWNMEKCKWNDADSAAEWLCEKHGWRLVQKSDMVLGKEYVAYRWAKCDFHFIRRHKNGNWSHKVGGLTPESISQKAVFGESWSGYNGNDYNSPILLFEVIE